MAECPAITLDEGWRQRNHSNSMTKISYRIKKKNASSRARGGAAKEDFRLRTYQISCEDDGSRKVNGKCNREQIKRKLTTFTNTEG